MRPDEFRQLLRRQPFVPFRLHVSDGTFYDITHPEIAGTLRSMAYVTLPAGGRLGIPYERIVLISFIHVTRFELVFPQGVSPVV